MTGVSCDHCGAPGALCANERCGQFFYQGQEGRRKDSCYCSERCANAQYQRERRRRVKASGQNGWGADGT